MPPDAAPLWTVVAIVGGGLILMVLAVYLVLSR